MLSSKTIILAILALCAMLIPTAIAAADIVMIDAFDDGMTNIDVTDPFWGEDEACDLDTDLLAVIGGERMTELAWQDGEEYATARANFRNSGVFSLSDDADVRATATLTYGMADLDADLTYGGENSIIKIVFNTADLEGELKITLVTSGDGEADQVSTWEGVTPSGVFGEPTEVAVAIDDAGWTHSDAGPADWTNIDNISISLTGAPNGDYVIEEIFATEIPEPAGLALLATGAAAILPRRRTRR